MSEATTTATRQPSTEKADRSLQHIAKKNRQSRTEYRLQFVESGEFGGNKVKRGDYTPRIYASEHAVMCAQALHNGYDQPLVNAVVCTIEATDIVRDANYAEAE